MKPKECKWCGSIWHSKNKCEKREIKPFQETYAHKRTIPPLSTENASEGLRLSYKGNSERSQLIGFADKYHSAYIRAEGGDGVWNWCYTCGTRVLIDEIQNGHFLRRGFINTRWDDMNCHPQCNECNVVKHGNLKVYEQKLRADYGDEAIDGLKQLAHSGNKVSQADIQEVIDSYKGVVF